MPEADRLSPDVFIAERSDISPALRQELAQLPSSDALLAAALQRTSAVVGRAGTPESKPSPVPVDAQTPVRIYGETPLTSVPSYKGHMTNLPQLEQAASGHGYLNTEPDTDGVVRRVPLLVAVQEALAPTFALELLRVAAGQDSYSVRTDTHGVRGVQIGDTFIRTDPDGRLRLYFSGIDPRTACLQPCRSSRAPCRPSAYGTRSSLSASRLSAWPMWCRHPWRHGWTAWRSRRRRWKTSSVRRSACRPSWAPWLELLVFRAVRCCY